MKTSVALCTYNGEKFLAQQLESIFRQSHPVNEIVVCDDGSSDNTLAVLEAFKEQYPRVLKIHRNEQNLGGRKNFEKCFSLCSGDVIFFCDQDDRWHANKVQKTLNWFGEDHECLGIATNARLIGENGEMFQKDFWQSFSFSIDDLEALPIHGLFDFVIRNYNIVAGAMLAIRKEAKPSICPFRFPNNIWHDEWITIVLSGLGKMRLVEEKLVDYRVHSGQQMGVGDESDDLKNWAQKLKCENKLQADPHFYLTHSWSTYQKLQMLQANLPAIDMKDLENAMGQRLQDAKKIFLNQQGLVLRKLKLLKWYREGRYATSWKDVIAM